MKITFLTITAFAMLATACGNTDVKPANAAAVQTPNKSTAPPPPKDGNYPGKGKVTKINMDLGSVELNHEEIVGIMPAMIMEFFVKDKALLGGIKVGDEVDFVLEYKHPAETIVEIKKIK